MFIDAVILFFLAIFLIFGVFEGFAVSVLKLAGWFLGILAAWLFSGSAASILIENINGLSPFLSLALGAFLTFLIVFLFFRTVAAIAKIILSKSSALTFINRILGGVFGLLKGFIVSFFILSIIHAIPAKGNLQNIINSSFAYSAYKEIPFGDLWGEFKIKEQDFI